MEPFGNLALPRPAGGSSWCSLDPRYGVPEKGKAGMKGERERRVGQREVERNRGRVERRQRGEGWEDGQPQFVIPRCHGGHKALLIT